MLRRVLMEKHSPLTSTKIQFEASWSLLVSKIMTKLGFLRSEVDSAVFYQRDETLKLLIIILVHMDDCSMTGHPKEMIQKFKLEIQKYVQIMDLGDLHWILGIEVHWIREDKQIMLLQHSYIDSILWCYGFNDAKPISTPMDPNVCLTSVQSPSTTEEFAKMKNIPYHEAAGSLMYASLITHHNITFAIQSTSWFSSKLGITHWEAVRRIFCYLKELEGFADADGSMAEYHKVISGYAFLIKAVSWSAKGRRSFLFLQFHQHPYYNPFFSQPVCNCTHEGASISHKNKAH